MQSLFDEGRAASPGQLLRRLGTSPQAYLDGALTNPALIPQHLLVILRNPAVTTGFIVRISRSPVWMKADRLRAAIALHPRTPRLLALSLLPTLGWSDLARISDCAVLTPRVRRAAETLLATRLDAMSRGERMSLARIAGRGLIGALCADGSPMVIRALLQNPRLREEDVLRITSRRTTPAAVLQAVSENRRFAARPEVQKAVAGNPAAPAPLALRLVRALPPRDLRELLHAPRLPTLLKVAVERLLETHLRPPVGHRARKRRPS